MKKLSIVALLIFTVSFSFAQTCNCPSNFEWVKKTFEQNDAGFQYVIDQKGRQAYDDYNKMFLEKVKAAKDLTECVPVLQQWFTFFRSGHFGIRLLPGKQATAQAQTSTSQFANWETKSVNLAEFEKYIDQKTEPGIEGIWQTNPYKIGIKKEGNTYVGFIIESGADTWKKDQVKLKIIQNEDQHDATFYLRDHSPITTNEVNLIGKNLLQIGQFNLSRVNSKFKDDQNVIDYLKSSNTSKPYVELINKNTFYIRIPSFNSSAKKDIDSVIDANSAKIRLTENLIIDLRGNGGGSDASYNRLIPLIYTNPMRSMTVAYLSTKLNNQRMLDFINKPEYGFDEQGKKWAKESYDKLEKHLGEFVNLNKYNVNLDRRDTVYAYPKNVGVLINHDNGSTTEEFLLAAKQSKKVKLFGATTFGVLDISNMYFVKSPCGEFELGYSLTKSYRIPEMTIDGKGIQPDFYLDKSIPQYEWVDFANKILNGK